MITVREISAKDAYPIRLNVLRKGMTISDCIFNGDEAKGAFHLGLFKQEELIGVASYIKNKNNLFPKTKQYQLRGMAILEGFQGYNYGNLLLKKGEAILKTKATKLLWFNAREIAVNFYRRNHYTPKENFFNIEGIGKHIVMFKDLFNDTI